MTNRRDARRLYASTRLALLLAALLPALEGAGQGDNPESALAGPITVKLKDGRSFSGRPISFRDEILTLRSELERGEVEQGFPRSSIARLEFPGQRVVAAAMERIDDGDLTAALPRLEEIWRQRQPFLPLLEPETVELLAWLPFAHLERDDPYRAIGVATKILPHATEAQVKDRLHETMLRGHYELEFFDDAEKLARDWIRDQEDVPTSAFGWKLLGDLALREEDFDRVVWITLQPIAMSGPQPMAHIEGCYALAIHAFHQRDEREGAARLHREMIERELSWPPDKALAETGEFYQSRLAEAVKKKAAAAEPDLDLRPPEEDLNLPIRKVRKLLQTNEP